MGLGAVPVFFVLFIHSILAQERSTRYMPVQPPLSIPVPWEAKAYPRTLPERQSFEFIMPHFMDSYEEGKAAAIQYEIRPLPHQPFSGSPVLTYKQWQPVYNPETKERRITQVQIDAKRFAFEKRLAASIFKAQMGTFEQKTGISVGRGTAFLVGMDTVFTNQHVFGVDRVGKNGQLDCGTFAVLVKGEWVGCEKVVFCPSVGLSNDSLSRGDFCLIRMKRTKNGRRLGEVAQPLKLGLPQFSGQEQHLVIGNMRNLGIQASWGRGRFVPYACECAGVVYDSVEKSFYSLGADGIQRPRIEMRAVFGPGTSGSPIFNERGEVIGIVDSGLIIGLHDFSENSLRGFGLPIQYVLGSMIDLPTTLDSIEINEELGKLSMTTELSTYLRQRHDRLSGLSGPVLFRSGCMSACDDRRHEEVLLFKMKQEFAPSHRSRR